MNNKLKLPQASLITALGILLCLMTAYVPMLSIFSMAVPVPYAIIGTLTDKKHSVISLIATFFILMFVVNPLYSITICVLNIIPGIFIGNAVKTDEEDNRFNKFGPIYIGTIITIICTIAFFFISNIFFKTNILEDFMSIIKESLNMQASIMEKAGIALTEGFKVSDILKYITNTLPTILFIQRIKIVNFKLPKFTDFNLPGNAVSVFFTLYMLVLFIDLIKANYLHTDLIMLNLQLIFNFMFMIQGISVSIYYLKKWIKSSSLNMVFIWGLILSMFGFMTVCFVGILDSIIDFRRIRSYKST